MDAHDLTKRQGEHRVRVSLAEVVLGGKGELAQVLQGAEVLRHEVMLLEPFYDSYPAAVTMAGGVIGTADYMPPEQAIDSTTIDHRADIYSLGCTMYYLLSGHPPFNEGTLPQRIMAHQREPVPDLRKERPDAPADLMKICAKMMAKKPENRLQNADEVADILRQVAVGGPTQPNRGMRTAELGDIIRPDYLFVADRVQSHAFSGWPVASRNEHVVLFPCLDGVQNDVLLQDAICPEGFFSRLEDVDAPQRHGSQKSLAKRLEIWAIAEAPRRDSNELTPLLEQVRSQGQKGSIQVRGLNPDRVQKPAMLRVTPDLFVRRVQDRAVKGKVLDGKEAASQHFHRRIDKVLFQDPCFERNSAPFRDFAASGQDEVQILDEEWLQLVGNNRNAARRRWLLTNPLYKGGSQASYARSRVQQANLIDASAEKRCHELRDRTHGEKLSHPGAIFRV